MCITKRVLLWIYILLTASNVNAQETIKLRKGDIHTFSTKGDIESVFIADPKVADYQVIDKRKVVLYGKGDGESGFAIFGVDGRTLYQKTISVNAIFADIKQQIKVSYPQANITLGGVGSNIVLSGVVSNEKEKDGIYKLVGELLAKKRTDTSFQLGSSKEVGFMTRLSYAGVVNNIRVIMPKQVNVKLSVAEVSHSFLENFGIKYHTQNEPNGTFVSLLTSFSASDIVSVITALGSESVGQILAQPNLSVMSGESASFLVGGEVPVVTVVDGTTNVDYKPYGISLELMAKVLEDDSIKLSLIPEVSTLDSQYTSDAYDMPAFKTRRARTTVQLGDGRSFVLGGLLSTEDMEGISKVPFVGDIPILGALFRSVETQRSQTELVIIATVNLVQPISEDIVELPTMQTTTSLSRFLNLPMKGEERSIDAKSGEIFKSGGFEL